MLGRTDAAGGLSSLGTRHLADLRNQAVYSELQPEDLSGLFGTLLLRLSPGKTPPIPRREVLLGWQETFSSDLVAFCWAVTAQHRRLRLGNWDLPPEAARRFVWK